ncbi:MAG TPA: hypothetical protein VN867_06335 [Candidatus Binataceae bacterium]|nr:hypothetical protein [Candidatus Binataceae bacterium]
MSKPVSIRRLFALISVAAFAAILFSTRSAFTDSVVKVVTLGALSENDSVSWSQLGPDATALSATITATSTGSVGVTGTLAAAGSLTSVVCPETPCSWGTPGTGGFNAGDTVVWTSDTFNGGNGPLKLTFSQSVKGAGALIQADGPAQFTAQIQAFNGTTSLGSFTETSDSTGDAVFLGALDNTAAHITAVTYSLTACTGTCTDFAIDTVYINDTPPGPTPVPTPPGPTPVPTPTPVATASITAVPVSVAFGNVDATGLSRARKIVLVNRSTVAANIGQATVPAGFTIVAGDDHCSNSSVAARRNCFLEVEFSPTTVSSTPVTGNLSVPYNGAAPATVSLSGTGTAVVVLSRSPRFAPVLPGDTSARPGVGFITNESRTATITLGTVTISGPFSIVAGMDSCSGQALAPRHRCTIEVNFMAPGNDPAKTTEMGNLSYSFTYGTNSGGPVNLPLSALVK